MNTQNIFYTLGSIYMVLGIITMLIIIFVIYYLIKKVNEIHDNITKRVEQEIAEIKQQPKLLASYVAHIVAKGIRNTMKNKT